MFYDTIIKYIDRDIERNIISNSTKRILSNDKYYRYFFEQLFKSADDKWIPILLENGLLTFDRKHGDFFIPLEYIRAVLRKSHQYDDVIVELLYDWKKQLNDPKLSDYNTFRISEICGLLDIQYAIKTTDIMLWCLNLPERTVRMVISEFVPFVKKLKEANADKEVLRIFKNIFKFKFRKERAFHSKEIQFVYDQYWVSGFFKEIKEVIQNDPLPYFQHLVKEYRKILVKVYPKRKGYDRNDYSNISRPAIEKSRHNLGVSTRDTIITMLRDIIDLAVGLENNKSILDILSKQEYPIFRRLAMYLFGERFDILGHEYEEQFINSETFSNYSFSHELWEVIRKCYSKFNNPQTIDKILSKGEQNLREDLEPERIDHYNWSWRYKWLSAIQKNSPTTERERELKYLEVKLGYEPEHPEFEEYSEIRAGWDSPCTIEQMTPMSWSEVKQYLLEFDETKAKITISHKPEYEGLRRVFEAVIQQKKDDFIQNIGIFKDSSLKEFYIGTVPSGIIPKDNTYNRKLIMACIDYLNWVLDEVDMGKLNFEDSNIYMLQFGFGNFFTHLYNLNANKDNLIPNEDFNKIVAMMYRFHKIAYEIVTRDMDLDNAEQSFISRVSGEYWQAFLALNFLRYRQINNPFIIHEFKELLTKSVGKDIFVNYLLGKYTANFYFLNKEWTLEHFNDIFPKSENKRNLWLAAMKAFLWSRSLRDELFEDLLPNIKKLCYVTLDEREQTALGDRIGFYYLRDKTHINCYQNLIKEIEDCYEKNPKLFSSFIHFLVRSYTEENNTGKRIRKYIRYRYNIIKKNPKNYKDEFEAILYAYKCFPDMKYSEYLIIRKAFEITDMNTRSLEIMELYTFFREKELFRYLIHLLEFELKGNTYPSYQSEEYSELFRALYQSGDTYVQHRTSVLINKLGEFGFYDFKDIYEEYLSGTFDSNPTPL